MPTHNQPFLFQGKYKHSSDIPTIIADGKQVSRPEWRQDLIKREAAALKPTAGPAVHIETGGGYGAFDGLIDYEKGKGLIPADVPIVRGEKFRDRPEFRQEKEVVRAEIKDYLRSKFNANYPEQNPEAVEHILRAFYSNEVNTVIAKEIVKEALQHGKSCAYESAAIYPDVVDRAKLAKEHGIKTILIAGDKDHRYELARPDINPSNVVASYKTFAGRFEQELANVFDEVRIYATDHLKGPHLFAKKEKDGALEKKDPVRYAKFSRKDNLVIPPPGPAFDVIQWEWQNKKNQGAALTA